MLSVIIPTCNRNELLNNCLAKLAPSMQTIAADAYEVIVTDDSKDGIAAGLIQSNYSCAKWVKGTERGPAANRNNGAKYAVGEWLVFIDDDCIPDLNLLSVYSTAIKANPDALAFEGAIFPDDPELLKKDMAECPVNTQGGCFWSANICINANLFKQVGGFDESFLIAAQEDQFLYYLLKQKTNIEFLLRARVMHAVRFVSLRTKLKKNLTAVRNWILYSAKRGMSLTKIIKTGYKFQCRSLLSNITSFKFKSSILNIHTLVIALPYLIFNHARSKFR